MNENIVNSLRYCAENDCSPKCPRAGIGKGCIAGLKREAADAIEELSKSRWVPVTEQSPEEYETVLLLSVSGEAIVGYYDSEHKSYCDMTGFRHLCTHWMPLPEPPKEE